MTSSQPSSTSSARIHPDDTLRGCSVKKEVPHSSASATPEAECTDTISVEGDLEDENMMSLPLEETPYNITVEISDERVSLSQSEGAIISEIPTTLEPPKTGASQGEDEKKDTLYPDSSDNEELIDSQSGAKCQPPPPFPSSDSLGLGEILGREQSSETFAAIPMPGESLGRYRILEILAKGGMGQILRARDEILQREVAIKIILPELLQGDPTAGLSFLREAEIVASLPHPHIIHVLDAGLDGTTAFLVFGYVKGENISDFCRRTRPQLGEAIDLLLPVLSAVKLAHDKNVVHGDLKPKNILVEEDYRARGHPWVLDFGASFHSGLDRRLDPMRGRVGGTPGYLAPEWITEQEVDGRADCFSLGCVFYEILVGRGPFSHCRRLSEVLEYSKTRDFPPPSQMVPIPSPIDDIISRCLEPNPDDRYPDIKSLARALLPFASARGLTLWRDEFALD